MKLKEESQLDMGKKVEMEHVSTFKKIKDFVEKNDGKFPADEQMAEWIAENHISEFPNYYDELKIMEDKLKSEGGKSMKENIVKIKEDGVEGFGEISPEKEQLIKDFIKTADNLDDEAAHIFYQSIGIEPHEAEEVVYRFVKELSDNKFTECKTFKENYRVGKFLFEKGDNIMFFSKLK